MHVPAQTRVHNGERYVTVLAYYSWGSTDSEVAHTGTNPIRSKAAAAALSAAVFHVSETYGVIRRGRKRVGRERRKMLRLASADYRYGSRL